MFATIKAYALQIALGAALLVIGVLGVQLMLAKVEISSQKVAVANAAAAFSKYVADGATITSAANQKNRDLERQLTSQRATLDQEKTHALEALAEQHRLALFSLRNRPSRPATTGGPGVVPAPGATAAAEQGCGRERLYREDAEVVIGLARAAADLRVELLDVRAQYEQLEAALAKALTQ